MSGTIQIFFLLPRGAVDAEKLDKVVRGHNSEFQNNSSTQGTRFTKLYPWNFLILFDSLKF